MNRPLPVLTSIFCAGIIIASHARIPFQLIYIFTAIFLILSCSASKKGLSFDIFLSCLIFLLGALTLKNSQYLPPSHISRYAYYQGDHYCSVKGFIASDPVFKINKTVFIFRTQEINFANFSANTRGDLLAYIQGRSNLGYGDALIISGKLLRPFKKIGTRENGYRDYLARQGIYAVIKADMPSRVIKLDYRRGFFFKRFALYLKEKMEKIIFKHLSYVSASVLDAMVLGEKRYIPPLLYNSMIKSGTVHILVVSGFNAALVFFIVVLFLKSIGLPRKIRIYLAIPLLILYCLLTGASNPVVRATVMAVVFLSSYLFKREPDIYNSLSLAALFILGINPRQLFDTGFQLSFVSVISIVYLYPKIKLWLRPERLKTKFLKFIADSFLVSLSAWLGTMGLVAYYFKIFSPVTVLANLFIVPLTTLITFCGFSLISAGLICPYLSPSLAWTCELLVTLLVQLNRFLIGLPGAYLYLAG